VAEEIRLLEQKYGVDSAVFEEMLKGRRPWLLPEGAEPDAVEWEALLEQKKLLERKLRELKEAWRELRDYAG